MTGEDNIFALPQQKIQTLEQEITRLRQAFGAIASWSIENAYVEASQRFQELRSQEADWYDYVPMLLKYARSAPPPTVIETPIAFFDHFNDLWPNLPPSTPAVANMQERIQAEREIQAFLALRNRTEAEWPPNTAIPQMCDAIVNLLRQKLASVPRV